MDGHKIGINRKPPIGRNRKKHDRTRLRCHLERSEAQPNEVEGPCVTRPRLAYADAARSSSRLEAEELRASLRKPATATSSAKAAPTPAPIPLRSASLRAWLCDASMDWDSIFNCRSLI